MKTAIDRLVDRLDGLMPRVAVVLGSGLGSLADEVEDAVRIPYAELPDFPVSRISGHAGEVVAGTIGREPVIMLSGRVHYYEAGDARVMRRPIEVLAGLGVQSLILTNAAGSLHEDMPPGSVMAITDHINFSGFNPMIGEEDDRRFVPMADAYDPALLDRMRSSAARNGVKLFEGVYTWFSGPSFETPAEVRMARILGGDAVGMSTVPEVIIARFFGLRVAAASVITNYGAGMPNATISHEQTKEMAPLGGKRLAAILKTMIAGGGFEL